MRFYNPEEEEYYNSDEHEVVEDICDICNGSGEGSCTEATCWWCKGWGVQYKLKEI